MSTDPLLVRARELWEGLARVPVSFGPGGSVRVVASPEPGICPPGWVGIVLLGGPAIVTAPSEVSAGSVRDVCSKLSAGELADPASVRRVLPVGRVLGPAALAYVSPRGFRAATSDQDLLPQWRARVPASRRVAAALGFRELGSQLSIEPV